LTRRWLSRPFDGKAAENIRRDAANQKHTQAHDAWKSASTEIEKCNTSAKLTYGVTEAAWLKEKQAFEEEQRAYNAGVADLRKRYLEKDPQAIARFCNEVISHSEYPDSFPRDSVVSFDPATEMLIVDFELPPEMDFPRLKQVRYIATWQEFQDVSLSDAEFRRLYDSVLYQICFRGLHELFESDEVNAIGSIAFNGWVRAVDKATGADTHPCILSIQVKKPDLPALNLAQVDLKMCFRSLRGISGGRLTDFTPVRPMISLNKNDPRFVAAYAVADSLDEGTNLAAMDWLGFENLIRGLFEKEFSKDSGEVKITQVSRDGGVDAIAFDPDPIRGAKIVIQAKRYTNTVGVAAVRDLYGIVHNEGAIKGRGSNGCSKSSGRLSVHTKVESLPPSGAFNFRTADNPGLGPLVAKYVYKE
jgi:restriction system protein